MRQSSMAGRGYGQTLTEDCSDVLVGGVKDAFEGYKEFRLDKRRAPHTVGLAHLYIRRDIVEATEREKIVPPYPITFPHDYSQ